MDTIAPQNRPQDARTDRHETRFAEMIFPEHANHYGTLFGGSALSLMGKAAFITASRVTSHPVVMAAAERVVFHAPAAVGQLAELTGRTMKIGRSSITVHVALTAETMATGERRLAVTGEFILVAVDGQGRPVPIAPAQGSP